MYKSTRWVHFRAAFLREFPFCGMRPDNHPPVMSQCHDAQIVTRANVVDHVQRHRGDFTTLFQTRACQSMCISCHGRKTAHEVGFGGSAA